MAAGAASLLNVQQGELTAGGWSVVETYRVFTTLASDGPAVVLTAPGLPAYFAALSFDVLARATRLTPIKQTDSLTHWLVEVEYTRETGNNQDSQSPPTARPVNRSLSIRWIDKALQQDKDGNAILTGAKTPFNPPVTVQVPHAVARFQRWEDTFTTALVDTYAGKVNSAQFGAYAPGRVLCTNIEAMEEWEHDENGDLQKYWNVTYEFEAAQEWDKWKPFKILDADFWFVDPDDGERKPIYVDKNGTYFGPPDPNLPGDAGAVPVPSPIPLAGPDGDRGDVLQANDLPQDAYYLEFDIYDTVDFNDLDLPVD